MRVKDDNKKHAIYQAAMALVTEQGLAGTSMSKIAKRAKVSPSTIYTYFDSKEDMLNKLYVMASEQSVAVFRQIKLDDTYDAYHQWVQAIFTFMVANPVLFSFKEQFIHSPQISDAVREEQFKYYQPFFSLIDKAMAAGEIRTMSQPVIIAMLFAPIQSLIWSHLRGEIEVTEVIISDLTQTIWSILATK